MGVCLSVGRFGTACRWVKVSTSAEITRLSKAIAHRVCRNRERQGLLVRDEPVKRHSERLLQFLFFDRGTSNLITGMIRFLRFQNAVVAELVDAQR